MDVGRCFVIPKEQFSYLKTTEMANQDQVIFSEVFIQFEKLDVELGDANDFTSKVPLSKRIKFYSSIIEALISLAEINYIYKDVHRSNFMLKKNENGDYVKLKMIDFGCLQKNGNQRKN